jgi:hypothetical protein
MKKGFKLKTKKIIGVLAGISLIIGFLLLNTQTTGNVILNNSPSFDILSFIGLLFVLVSAFLAVYIIKK